MKRLFKISALVLILLFASLAVVYYKFPGVVLKSGIAMARVSAGLSLHTIKAGEYEWPYLSGGSGETVVILHGFGMHKDLMIPLAGQFTDRYRVIVPDLPAFGENKHIAGSDYGISPQSKRLKVFLSALKTKQMHLIGLSMGGGIASWFTAEYPDTVKSLTIIGSLGTNPGKESPALEAYRKDNTRTLCIKTRDDMERVFRLAYKYPPKFPEHFKEYLLPKYQRNHKIHTPIITQLVKEDLSCMEPRLKMIKAPTLLLWGEEDQISPLRSARTFHRGIKNSRLVIIKDCGHVTFTDQPEKSFTAMKDFLGTL